MNLAELLGQLAQRGTDIRVIYTGDGNPEDLYAIILENDMWNVYYMERGGAF